MSNGHPLVREFSGHPLISPSLSLSLSLIRLFVCPTVIRLFVSSAVIRLSLSLYLFHPLVHVCSVNRLFMCLWQFVLGTFISSAPHPPFAMESRRHKRLRTLAQRADLDSPGLEDLVHTGNVTTSALAAIVAKINNNPELLQGATPSRLDDASHAAFFGMRHVHTLYLGDDATPFEWEMADPNRLVSYLVESSPRLQDAFARAAVRNPCSAERPWHLVLAWDEFTPGMVLSPNNARKTMALSFSFIELGHDQLWHEESWFTPVLVRSTIIAETSDGWSGMLRIYLHLHLFSSTGIATAGLPLTLHGQQFLLFATLSHMLADGDGLRSGLQWKGAASLKCCIRHWNVLKLNSDIACRDATYVEIDCASHDKFKSTTSNDLHDMVDSILTLRQRVSAGEATMSKLTRIQMACGLSCTPHGLLACPELRRRLDILGSIRFDWMHCVLQDGTLTTEASLLLTACEGLGFTSSDLEAHFKNDWVFPQQHQSKGKFLWRIFDQSRKALQDKVKASASEMLLLYVLLRQFFVSRIAHRPELAANLRSFCAACACVDILLSAKRRHISTRDASARLFAALRHHGICHVAAYGNQNLKPKFHWLWDIAELLCKDDFVLDCFVVERLHKRAKSIANNIRNTRCYERSVLAGVLAVHRSSLRTPGSPVFGLAGQTAPLPDCQAVSIGRRLVHEGLHISVGDMVFADDAMGCVAACCMQGGMLYVVVEEMVCHGHATKHSTIWQRPTAPSLQVWCAGRLDLAVAWSAKDPITVVRM